MKKFYKLLPILFLTLTLTGCIDVQYKMFLRTDGSGTIEETVYMNSAMVQMLKGFMAMGNDSTNHEEFSLFDEDDLRNEAKNLGKGVRYVSGEALKENGREGYKAIFEFDDINKIKMNEDVSDKASPMGEEEEDTPEDDITFKFTKGSPATLMIYMPEEKETESEEEVEIETDTEDDQDTEWTEEMKSIMKDFRIAISIEFEGDIVETNATNVDGSTVTLLEMSFDKIIDDPENLKKLKGLGEHASHEKTKEILKDIPGIKFETNQKVKVVFD
jgi:hypothetical protein